MFRMKLVSKKGWWGGGGAEQSAVRDSQPAPLPLLKPMPFSFSAHRSKGQGSQEKISVIGHRPAVSKVEDISKLPCVT